MNDERTAAPAEPQPSADAPAVDYREEQRKAKRRLRMGRLYPTDLFFNRGARQFKARRKENRNERRTLLKEMKKANGGLRVDLQAA